MRQLTHWRRVLLPPTTKHVQSKAPYTDHCEWHPNHEAVSTKNERQQVHTTRFEMNGLRHDSTAGAIEFLTHEFGEECMAPHCVILPVKKKIVTILPIKIAIYHLYSMHWQKTRPVLY
jgi:hypothetical protein